LKTGEELLFQGFIGEEPATGAGVDGSERGLHNTEALLRDGLVFAKDNDSARAHVFLFADDGRYAFLAVESECLVWMFEQVLVLACLCG
jgi:hypothetical protein